MSSMRVFQINTSFRNGGSTGRIAYGISQSLKRRGWEDYAAFAYGDDGDNINYFRIQDKIERKASILKTRVFGMHGLYNKRETVELLGILDKIKPDVIQLHNLHNHYINIQLLFDYIKKNNIPTVWTLHDCWSFTGWCAYFDYKNCSKWKTGCNNCCAIHEYPFTWFFDRSRELYQMKRDIFSGVNNLTIVTPCKWLSELVGQSFLSEYPRHVIYNGVDTRLFRPYIDEEFRAKYNLENKKIVLSVASVFDRRKGTDFILRLPDKLPEDHTLVMVGVSEKLKKKLSSKCIAIPRTNDIHELACAYSAADVFINPTLEDNFPTTNIEALACGTPIVTYRTGGSPEAIDNNTGIVVEKGNEDKFIEAIISITKKKKENVTRVKCVERCQALFQSVERYNDYCKLYEEVANK